MSPNQETQDSLKQELHKDRMRKWWLGCFLLLFVNIFLVTSSELSQYLYDSQDYEKPFVITYVSCSLFSLYLILLFALQKWNDKKEEGKQKEEEEGLMGSKPQQTNLEEEKNWLYFFFPNMTSGAWNSENLSFTLSPIYFFGLYSYYFSTQYTTVSSATIIQSLQVVFAFVFDLLLKKYAKPKDQPEPTRTDEEKLKEKKVFMFKTVGVLITCLGVFLVGLDDSSSSEDDSGDDTESEQPQKKQFNLLNLSSSFYFDETNTTTTEGDDTGDDSSDDTGVGGIPLTLWGDFFGLCSTLLYSLFSVLFDHFCISENGPDGSTPQSHRPSSIILSSRARSQSFSSSVTSLSEVSPSIIRRFPQPLSIQETHLQDGVSDLSGKEQGEEENRERRKQRERTDIEQTLFFFGRLGLFCLIWYWPVGILFHLTGLEPFELPSLTIIGNLFVLAILGSTLTDLLWVFAILWTNAVLANVALVLGIPIAMGADLMLGKFVPSVLYCFGAVLTLIGFVLVHWADLPSIPTIDDDEQTQQVDEPKEDSQSETNVIFQ